MNTDKHGSEGEHEGVDQEEAPGLPGLRRWRGVYAFVLGGFVVWVALLAWLTEVGQP